MKSKNKIKKEFKVFFDKHPEITSIPFVCTVVIPKYECRGERIVMEFSELDDDILKEHYKGNVDISDDDKMDKLYEDIPTISDKDAFYQFDEDTLVVVTNEDGEIKLTELDYSDEIFDWY